MRLLIFDIDGTLIDMSSYDGNYYDEAVREMYGISMGTRDWKRYRNATDFGILHEIVEEEFGRELGLSEFLEFEDILGRIYLERNTEVRSLKGAREFVEKARNSGRTAVGIATGNSRRIAEYKLERAQFDPDDFIISSSNDSMVRSEILKDCEQKTTAMHNVEKYDSITYFGDRIWDFNAARDLGYGFVGIGLRLDELTEGGAENCFSHFEDMNLHGFEV